MLRYHSMPNTLTHAMHNDEEVLSKTVSQSSRRHARGNMLRYNDNEHAMHNDNKHAMHNETVFSDNNKMNSAPRSMVTAARAPEHVTIQ
jgi:hypothetical protein